MSKPARQLYRFGPFLLDPTKPPLIREATGEPVLLSDRRFKMLCLFVRNSNRLYSTTELLEKFWPDREVEENNLTQNIHALRTAFGEKPGENKYIQTIGKDGYRFVAQVTVTEVPDDGETREREVPVQVTEEKPPPPKPAADDKPPAPPADEEPESPQALVERLAAKPPTDGMDAFREWLSGPGRFIMWVLAACIVLTIILSGLGIYHRWEWTNMFVSLAQSLVLFFVLAFPLSGPTVFRQISPDDEEGRAVIRIGAGYDDWKEWETDSYIAKTSFERYTLYWRGILFTWLLLYVSLIFIAHPDLDLGCRVEPSNICVGGLKDPNLAGTLRTDPRPLSRYLRARFSQETQDELGQYDESGVPPASLQRAVVRDLNKLLKDAYLQQFANDLTDQEKNKVAGRLKVGGLAAANRLILDYFYQDKLLDTPSQYVNHGLSILTTLLNNLSSLMIFLCFNILNKPTEIKQGEQSIKDTYLSVGAALVVIFTVGEFLAVALPLRIEKYLVLQWCSWASGIFGGVAMALYVGRLQSKFLGPPPLLLIALYSYTAIQSLFVFLEVRQAGAVALMDVALILKCLLFLYMMWLFQSGRLLFYFVRVRRTYRDVKTEWRVIRNIL